MKKLILLLALLVLAGCSSKKAPQQEAVAEVPPSTDAIYLYENGSRYLAIDDTGAVIMEVQDGQMYILKENEVPVSLAVTRTEGSVTNEYGWTEPEKQWCDFYDPSGKFLYSLPINYTRLSNGLLIGYNQQEATTQVYRFADGMLLYDDVHADYMLKDTTYITQGSWDAPGVFLNRRGEIISRLDDEYCSSYSISGGYLIVKKNALCGLVRSDGTEVLPAKYQDIREGKLGCVHVQTPTGWQVIELETGQIKMEHTMEIHIMAEDYAVVMVDEDDRTYRLVDRNGNPLMKETFYWPNGYDTDGDDLPDLFNATLSGSDATCVFNTHGKILWQADENVYPTVLANEKVLLHQYLYDEYGNFVSNKFQLLDLKTNKMTDLKADKNTYYNPLYTTTGMERGYICQSSPNEQGWSRSSILDVDGNVLLKDLKDMYYRGNGVFQCSYGFRSGLLRIDGTWLYEESSFSALDDN